MSYEFFYEGTPNSLDPSYGELFIGYRLPHAQIGAPTNPQTANQIQDVSNMLNQGMKTLELQPLSPEVFDQIPKQHFKEIARLQKLAGADTTIHAPIVEPSGITKEGWSEIDRESAERQLQSVIDKSHDLAPKGNILVNVHASAVPGAEFIPTEEGVKEKRLVAINQETKQTIPVEREIKYYPETGKQLREPKQEIGVINNTEWTNSVTNLAFYKKEADETLKNSHAALAPLIAMKEQGQKINFENLDPKQRQALQEIGRTDLFLENVEASFRTLYNKAYKYSDDQTRDFLEKEVSDPWKEGLNEIRRKIKKSGGDYLTEIDVVAAKSNLIDNTLSKLKLIGEPQLGLKVPQVYKPLEDFATEKTSSTFANVALHGYEKYGKNAPIVSVENLYPGMAFSRSQQLKNLIDESREKFMIEAVKKGYSKSEAKKTAEKLIGATWDVGHANIARKYGFKKEDIVKEAKEIAPYLKHVHLTDNFGYSDSHLPPGMGNVPTKEILEKFEKAGFKGKKIIEAGAFPQHFKVSPMPAALEALGTPVFADAIAAPYWNQAAATYGGYFSGYGPVFPEQHFSMYGAGFSGMPAELGGQMPGKQSRFSGTPNE